MAQFLFELKTHRKSFFFWALSLFVFIFLIMIEFSAYRDNPQLLEILEVFPQEMLIAFGLIGANLTTVSGFTSLTLLYIQLALAIYASLLGVIIVGKETRWKTSDFLYVMPRSRIQLLIVKFGAGLIMVSGLTLLVGVFFAVVALQYEPEPLFFSFLVRSHLAMLLTVLVFYALGYLLSTTLKSSKLASTLASVSVFALYILSILISLVSTLEWLKPISVFSWISFPELIESGFASFSVVVGSLLVVAACCGMGLWIYPKRDLGTFR